MRSVARTGRLLSAILAALLSSAAWAQEPLGSIPDHLDSLRLNEFQSIGTHNSYHEQPSAALDDLMVNVLAGTPDAVPAICPGVTEADDCVQQLRYTHDPLETQLDNGMRQFELDVVVDPPNQGDGSTNRYLYPLGYQAAQGALFGPPVPFEPEAMSEPGFKTIHVPDLDFRSNCQPFVDCLERLRAWSLQNSDHPPILILIEAKDDPLPALGPFSFVVPLEFNAPRLWVLDLTIRSVFDRSHVIIPGEVQGAYATLREAVTQDGWPTLGESRGRFILALDNGEPYISNYLSNFPSGGEWLFTNSAPDADDAAFVKRNDPAASDIASLVEQGFLIRTRADADTLEAVENSTQRRDQAFASGAQFVSTDYPEPDLSLSNYSVAFDGGATVRCNPVNTSAETCQFAPDTDADGLPDPSDACPLDPRNDVDADTVCGDVDNCPETPNLEQLDLDRDTRGDACDADIDGDRIPNSLDAYPNDSERSIDRGRSRSELRCSSALQRAERRATSCRFAAIRRATRRLHAPDYLPCDARLASDVERATNRLDFCPNTAGLQAEIAQRVEDSLDAARSPAAESVAQSPTCSANLSRVVQRHSRCLDSAAKKRLTLGREVSLRVSRCDSRLRRGLDRLAQRLGDSCVEAIDLDTLTEGRAFHGGSSATPFQGPRKDR